MLRKRNGFTLVELLIVMGVIATLASIVIVAINPTVQLAKGRNAKRRSHVKTLLTAIQQNVVGKGGSNTIPTSITMLGTAGTACATPCGQGATQTYSVNVNPSADSYLYQFLPTNNFGNLAQLQVYPWTPGNTKRAILKFDLSFIPAGSTINSAVLTLKEAATYGNTRTVGAHRVTKDWTESIVNWNNAATGSAWTAPGGDFNAAATANASIVWGGGPLDTDTWDVKADVQEFANGTASNYGWLLKDSSEDSSQAYWFFDAREGATPPVLAVNYTSGAESTAAACLDLTSSIVGEYVPSIPYDPSTGDSQRTYYAVKRSTTNNRLTVRACSAELGETIEALQ